MHHSLNALTYCSEVYCSISEIEIIYAIVQLKYSLRPEDQHCAFTKSVELPRQIRMHKFLWTVKEAFLLIIKGNQNGPSHREHYRVLNDLS